MYSIPRWSLASTCPIRGRKTAVPGIVSLPPARVLAIFSKKSRSRFAKRTKGTRSFDQFSQAQSDHFFFFSVEPKTSKLLIHWYLFGTVAEPSVDLFLDAVQESRKKDGCLRHRACGLKVTCELPSEGGKKEEEHIHPTRLVTPVQESRKKDGCLMHRACGLKVACELPSEEGKKEEEHIHPTRLVTPEGSLD